MTRLRGALLGAGNVALSGHAPQWSRPEIAAEAEIVAVADLSEANRAAAQRHFPAARVYATAEELIARERLDFCDICTPPATHGGLVTLAVDHGLHVLCEKPLAAALPEAEAMAARVRGSGVVFRMCHQYHHAPMWRAAAAYLPTIGRIHLAEYQVHRLSANAGNANWTPSWRTSAAVSGGGVIVDHGAHVFYLLREAMGEADTVHAAVRTLRHREYEVDDTACVLLDHGDALARVTLTWAACRREIRFRFVGEHGEVTGDETAVRLAGRDGDDVTTLAGMSEGSSHSEWFGPLFAGFVRAVRTDDRDRTDLDEAVYVARVIGAAYESSRTGRVVPLPAGVPARSPVTDIEEPEPVRATGSDLGLPRRAVFRTTALLILVASAIWMGHDVAWHDVLAFATGAKASWILAAAAVNMAGVLVLQAARWLFLVRPLSPAATLGKAWRAMIVGFTVSSFVPARGGELARVEWFGRETGLPRMAILGSILLDHMVNAAGLLLGMAILPLFLHVPLWMRPGGWMTAALFATGAAFILLLRPIGERAAAVRPDSRVVRAVTAWLARIREGLHATRDPRALGWSFGASAGAWALEANVTTLSLRAVGLHLPLGSVLLVLLAVNLALALPVATPANLGTLEIGATLTLVGMGVAKERALAFALWYHFLQIIPIVIVGLYLVAQAWRRARREPSRAW